MNRQAETKGRDHRIEVLLDSEMDSFQGLPAQTLLVDWAMQALLRLDCQPSELSIKIVSMQEMSSLNAEYRQKHGPTNVLSFPMHIRSEDGRQLLGDIAICAEVVRSEAKQQDKSIAAHFAHMVVHGVLHLSGHGHEESSEASEMEEIEVAILRTIGFPDPYLAR